MIRTVFGQLIGLAAMAAGGAVLADGEIDLITRLVSGPGALGLCGFMIWLFAKHMQRAESRQVARDKEIAVVLAVKEADNRNLVAEQCRMTHACTLAISESTEVTREMVREFRHRPCLADSFASEKDKHKGNAPGKNGET